MLKVVFWWTFAIAMVAYAVAPFITPADASKLQHLVAAASEVPAAQVRMVEHLRATPHPTARDLSSWESGINRMIVDATVKRVVENHAAPVAVPAVDAAAKAGPQVWLLDSLPTEVLAVLLAILLAPLIRVHGVIFRGQRFFGGR